MELICGQKTLKEYPITKFLMPTINIYYKDLGQQKDLGRQLLLNSIKDELKSLIFLKSG